MPAKNAGLQRQTVRLGFMFGLHAAVDTANQSLTYFVSSTPSIKAHLTYSEWSFAEGKCPSAIAPLAAIKKRGKLPLY